jgi:hypothetical protein
MAHGGARACLVWVHRFISQPTFTIGHSDPRGPCTTGVPGRPVTAGVLDKSSPNRMKTVC